jgi:hypothetical protein
VIFLLLDKLYKDEHKATIELKGIETIHNINTMNTNSYELNNLPMEEEKSGFIEENSLTIQIACEIFFTHLKKTLHQCPYQFHVICQEIASAVKEKYPNHKVELCLAPFLFLRFFVAGMTVPESFGIIDKHPDPTMRRRLILISKVLSNMSTQVKFGGKEV